MNSDSLCFDKQSKKKSQDWLDVFPHYWSYEACENHPRWLQAQRLDDYAYENDDVSDKNGTASNFDFEPLYWEGSIVLSVNCAK